MNTKEQMMNTATHKALIIGFGSIGKKHFQALKKLHIQSDILSKSTQSYEKAKIFKTFKQTPLQNYNLFIIAHITSKHYQILKKLDYSLENKIILVEKPLFDKVKKYQASGKNTIYIAYLLRFHPVITSLKELLLKQKPYLAHFICHSYLPLWRKKAYTQSYSAKKSLGGGVINDLSHELDLALFFFKDLKLQASINKKISELKIESDDFAHLYLSSKKCENILISLDYFSKFEERIIQIHSPKQSFKADLLQNSITIYDKKQRLNVLKIKPQNCLEKLHQGILDKDKRLCSLKEALRLLQIIQKAKNAKKYSLHHLC